VSILNSFHGNIQFTYEVEQDGKIPFLDVNVINNNGLVETTVYRKPTNTELYLHWESFAPITWKRGTVKTLVRRAYTICSNSDHLNNELKHLKHVFTKINGYPLWIINQVFQEIKDTYNNRIINESSQNVANNNENEKKHLLILPYKGDQGKNVIKSMVNTITRALPEPEKIQVVYTSTKLGSAFQIKDQTEKKHMHDLVYMASCNDCDATYVGETARRFNERIKDHSGRDHNSHVYCHLVSKNHAITVIDNFKILYKGFKNNAYKRKISEALFIQELKPSLNAQEKSIPLKLLN